jgi:hypothetical protein
MLSTGCLLGGIVQAANQGDPHHTPADLTEPLFVPAQGVLQSGGVYVWRIHARDSDGNVLLGNFNHGSLSPEMRFTVK